MEVIHAASVSDHRCKDTYPSDIAQFDFKLSDQRANRETLPPFSCTLELSSTKSSERHLFNKFKRHRGAGTIQPETKTLKFHVFTNGKEVFYTVVYTVQSRISF